MGLAWDFLRQIRFWDHIEVFWLESLLYILLIKLDLGLNLFFIYLSIWSLIKMTTVLSIMINIMFFK